MGNRSWKSLFEGAKAPFSWEPERVEVLDSGTLALSTGPIRDPEGRQIGTFNSVLFPDSARLTGMAARRI